MSIQTHGIPVSTFDSTSFSSRTLSTPSPTIRTLMANLPTLASRSTSSASFCSLAICTPSLASADCLRFGICGHNFEANSILYYRFKLGLPLSLHQHDAAIADRWSQLAAGLQSAAIHLLWQPDVGLVKDNETTTLAPQDGNTWAVKSGLVTDALQIVLELED
ncbi:hypothetical protein BD309DRAFT_945454 [Dichomitus squalens]|uniref:Uncharacterized protein n=1 Tax=Dichomitus squalens TaxID=114155 RepID=A0A4Q9Q7H6_9APHY|nr:hypothetical protein BD309DRAFT_945454 [Dichomitus squalens]TBU62921.1 hypothetical protein BD310DRAFT_973913 [Dichomitus squalens]